MFKIADFGGSTLIQKKDNLGQIKTEFTVKGNQFLAHTLDYIAPEFFEYVIEQESSSEYDE